MKHRIEISERQKRKFKLGLLKKFIESKKTPMIGNKNWQWKGNKVGYFALHEWIRRYWGKANHCENMKCLYPRYNSRRDLLKYPKGFEWANLGKFTRNRKNWIQLCHSCHKRFDLNLISIKKYD